MQRYRITLRIAVAIVTLGLACIMAIAVSANTIAFTPFADCNGWAGTNLVFGDVAPGATHTTPIWEPAQSGAWVAGQTHQFVSVSTVFTINGVAQPPASFGKDITRPTAGCTPPTRVPPTVPPTPPPTAIPPTSVPPTTVPPTSVPPTSVPPTAVPPTSVPPTSVPPTSPPAAPQRPTAPVRTIIVIPEQPIVPFVPPAAPPAPVPQAAQVTASVTTPTEAPAPTSAPTERAAPPTETPKVASSTFVPPAATHAPVPKQTIVALPHTGREQRGVPITLIAFVAAGLAVIGAGLGLRWRSAHR